MIETFEDKTPSIAASAYIDPRAVLIGDVTVGEESSVWPMVVIRGDIHKISIGKRSNIQDGTVVHVTHAGEFNETGFPVIIGNEVIIGHQAVLHGCTLKDNCLIGIGARILDGVTVESHVIVGAGSVVPPGKTLESGFLWMGVPAVKTRALTEKELQYFAYSADYYVKLKDRYQSFALRTGM